MLGTKENGKMATKKNFLQKTNTKYNFSPAWFSKEKGQEMLGFGTGQNNQRKLH